MVKTTKSNVDTAMESVNSELRSLKDTLAYMKWIKTAVAPLLPDGVELPVGRYDYYPDFQTIVIPEVKGRSWRGLDGTAGIIYKVRKALGIRKLDRNTTAYSDYTRTNFTGTSTIDDKSIYWCIEVGTQLPPTCHVEYVEVTETITRKQAKVICE